MKITKTLQIQLMTNIDEIVTTLSHFQDALNYCSQYAYDHEIYEKYSLQTLLYYDIREKYGLKSQMAINCLRKVASCYGLKDGQKAGRIVTFKRKFMLLNYPRDYRIVNDNIISINTLNKRKKVTYKIGRYQSQLLADKQWIIKSSTLIQRKDDKIFLCIAIESERVSIDISKCDGIIGIDIGIHNVAVITNSKNKSTFYGGQYLRHLRWQFSKQRSELQSKGTRSAKRKLQKLSRREKRFVTNTNHCIAKHIISESERSFKLPIFIMEDLTGIRKNRCKTKRGAREFNSWAFYQLQQFIEYKALEKGHPVIYIDPHYTSQICPRCGHTEKSNRNQKKHWFRCKTCGYQSNDDRVGSINIRNRATVSRYIRESKGVCQSPDNCVL